MKSGLGVRPNPANPIATQRTPLRAPELVLQAGITSPKVRSASPRRPVAAAMECTEMQSALGVSPADYCVKRRASLDGHTSMPGLQVQR